MKPRHLLSTAGVLIAALCSIMLFAQDDTERKEVRVIHMQSHDTNGGLEQQQAVHWQQQGANDARLTLKYVDTPLIKALQPLAMMLRQHAGDAMTFNLEREFDPATDDVEVTTDTQDDGISVTRVMVRSARAVDDMDSAVLVQDELARDIVISLEADSKTVAEMVDLIAIESGCNIYVDGETIVVDLCGN